MVISYDCSGNRWLSYFQVRIMDALKAGLLAWTIEITVAALIFLALRNEENKVIKRRKNKPIRPTED